MMELDGLLHCPANFQPLSPVTFLKRAAALYGGRTSIVHGARSFTWSETYRRCLKLASALVHHFHLSTGDLVAAMAPNIPELYELHYAVPMAGAIICPLNTKLDSPTLALLLHQLHPKIIFVDSQFLPILLKSLSENGNSIEPLTVVVVVIPADPDGPTHPPEVPCYDGVLAMGFDNFTPRPNGQLDAISVNCTSGSTGLHKGVIYSHRATYLNSLATIIRSQICRSLPPVFLWTVDMFRCNGWCFVWAVAAVGGCNVCLRTVTAEAIFDAVELHEVTLCCGSPAILRMISESSDHGGRMPLQHRVDLIVAGALPIGEILNKVTQFGFNISYGYGMTEALGPVIIRPNEYSTDDNSGSGGAPLLEDLITSLEVDVKDSTSMESVAADGETLGEIMLRGNTLMSGYFKNPKATKEAFTGDWYRTGDVGVRHKSGRIEMKDRAKDIIVVADGAVVSTVAVEAVLLSHPKVAEAAVVGKYVAGSGERPCGFVKLRNGCKASAEEIVGFCGEYLPEFMVPESIVFGDLPANSTGKVQKFIVKENVKAFNLSTL